jgi:hypothetical protein
MTTTVNDIFVKANLMFEYLDRAKALWKEVLERREDFKELSLEMKSNGLSATQIAAVNKAAKRAFWDEKQREREEVIAQLVAQLEEGDISEITLRPQAEATLSANGSVANRWRGGPPTSALVGECAPVRPS